MLAAVFTLCQHWLLGNSIYYLNHKMKRKTKMHLVFQNLSLKVARLQLIPTFV